MLSKQSALEQECSIARNEVESLKTFQNDMHAHHWWEYVYHEFVKREKTQRSNILLSATGSGSSGVLSVNKIDDNKENVVANTSQPETIAPVMLITNLQFELPLQEYEVLKAYPQLITNIVNTRNNLVLQATELSNLRQEMLSKKMLFHRQLTDAKNEIETKDREIMRLSKMYQNVRASHEIKFNELTMTIRSLSSRSDLHAQLAASRSELEVEKLTNYHLRDDIDTYRQIIKHKEKTSQHR